MTTALGIASLLAAGAVAAGGMIGGSGGHPASGHRAALVIDAPEARAGRALVDPRLRAVDADLRLPRDASEASTDVRYFAARGYELVVVTGPWSTAAARGAGITVRRVADLGGAVSALPR